MQTRNEKYDTNHHGVTICSNYNWKIIRFRLNMNRCKALPGHIMGSWIGKRILNQKQVFEQEFDEGL